MALEEIRREIDEVDAQLIACLQKRLAIAERVALYKKENHLPILDRKREEAVLAKVSQQAGEAYAPYVRQIYEAVFAASRALQEDA